MVRLAEKRGFVGGDAVNQLAAFDTCRVLIEEILIVGLEGREFESAQSPVKASAQHGRLSVA